MREPVPVRRLRRFGEIELRQIGERLQLRPADAHAPDFKSLRLDRRRLEIQRGRTGVRNQHRRKDQRSGDRTLEIELELVGAETEQPPLRQAIGFIAVGLQGGDLADRAAADVFEDPRRLHPFAAVDAEADDLFAGQRVNVLELDGACEVEQSDIDAHPDDIACDHAVGALVPAYGRGGAHLRARNAEAAEMHYHLRRMDRQHRIGGDLARGRTQHEIGARRVAHRAAGPEFAMEFAARLFQLEADVAVLRLEAALSHHRARHPRGDGFFTQHGAHRQRLVQIAAGRGEIDRQFAIPDFLEKFPEARRGAGIDLPFDRDPAIAAVAARVRRTLGDIERHRRHRRRAGRRPRSGRRSRDGLGLRDGREARGRSGSHDGRSGGRGGSQSRAASQHEGSDQKYAQGHGG